MKTYTITAQIDFDDLDRMIDENSENMSEKEFVLFAHNLINVLFMKSDNLGCSKELSKKVSKLVENYK